MSYTPDDMPRPDGLDPDGFGDLGPGALLRCAADGELPSEARTKLDAYMAANPDAAARIRFEQDLRQACARVMGRQAEAGKAPAALRATITARLTAAAAKQNGHARAESPPDQPVIVGRIGPSWVRRYSLAIAAGLAIGVGGLMLARLGIVGGGSGAGAGDAIGVAGVNGTEGVVVLSAFLTGEHERYCSAEAELLGKKLTVTKAESAPAFMEKLLGKPVSIEDMEAAGFQFIGLGECSVPGTDRSVHLLFRRGGDRGGDGVPVSLFVEIDDGTRGFEEGFTYAMCGEQGGLRVRAWRHEGMVYYLVTKCSRSCDAAIAQLHAPSEMRTLSQ